MTQQPWKMFDLENMTAADFSHAMHEGWKDREWCGENWWEINGRATASPERSTHCCAIGAMAIYLGKKPMEISNAIHSLGPRCATSLLNKCAGNKEAAMKAIDAALQP